MPTQATYDPKNITLNIIETMNAKYLHLGVMFFKNLKKNHGKRLYYLWYRFEIAFKQSQKLVLMGLFKKLSVIQVFQGIVKRGKVKQKKTSDHSLDLSALNLSYNVVLTNVVLTNGLIVASVNKKAMICKNDSWA